MKERQGQNKVGCLLSKAESWANTHLNGLGLKFTRQAIWGYRVFDFWFSSLGVAVEVDGKEHCKEYDQYRDIYNYLRSGVVILRVRNFSEEDMAEAKEYLKHSITWDERRGLLNTDILRKHGGLTNPASPYWDI